MIDPHPSDSSAWRLAETTLLAWLGKRDGLSLAPKRLELASGTRVELDGFCEEPLVLCEVYSRLGPVASSTVYKACADAMKLVWIRDAYMPGARVVLLIANQDLEKRLTGGRGWRPLMLRSYGVEIVLAELDDTSLDALHKAEELARRGMIPAHLLAEE